MRTDKLLLLCALISAVALGTAGPLYTQETTNLPQPSQSAVANTAKKTAAVRVLRSLLQSPMSFEVNQGQTDKRVSFLSRGSGYTLFLTPSSAVLALNRINPQAPSAQSGFGSNPANPLSLGSLDRTPPPQPAAQRQDLPREDVLQMQLIGANSTPKIVGDQETATKTNYFIGKDPSQWRTGIKNFRRVHYTGMYPGIDLVYYGNQRQLEYDFVVAPHADASLITLGFSQLGRTWQSATLHLDPNGDLVVSLAGGDVHFHKPVVYQFAEVGKQATRHPVRASYALRADGKIGFEVGPYDRSRELVIDPVISFATYLGGSNEDYATAIGIDKYEDVVIAGSTRSSDFPVEDAIESYHPGTCGSLPCRDVFVSKFNPTGSALQYSTYIGGSNDDVASQLVLDKAGDIFVVGYTLSTDFPITSHATQKTFGGGTVTGDAFAFELASKGGIAYSTYIGGSGDEVAYGVSVDYAPSATPNLYVVGSTTSENFPVTTGAYQTVCGKSSSGICQNGFATKLGSQDTSVVYSTYLGGSGGLGDAAYGAAVDSNDNLYITGITGSANFPTTPGAYDRTCGSDGLCNGTYDGFVTALNENANGLFFSTFLGGSNYDYTAGIAVDSTGAVYVSGNTISTDFPTTSGAAQTTFGGMSEGCVPTSGTCGDVTVTKLNPGGETLAYSTYLGGSLDEYPGMSMAIDSLGDAYLTGQTSSANFPLVSPFQATYGGGSSDAFVTIVNPTGTAWESSSYLGGNGQDFGYRTVVDSSDNVFVSGGTLSTNFPATSRAFQKICGTDGTCNGGYMDAWAAKLIASADVAVSIQASANPVKSGANLKYQIKVRNNGPDTALNISMTDATPTGTTFVTVTTTAGTCTAPPVGGTGTVTCTTGSLASLTSITVTMEVNVTASSGSVLKDTATVTSTTQDPRPGNNSVTLKTNVD